MKYYLNDQEVDEQTYQKVVKDHAAWVQEQEKKALEAAKLAAKPEKKPRIKK